MGRWLCGLLTRGRHRPAVFEPVCTLCSAVVPTGIEIPVVAPYRGRHFKERTTMPEILKRAVATAAQAGLAVLLASGMSEDIADLGVWRAAGLAAAAGALSFAHRSIQTYLGDGPAGT